MTVQQILTKRNRWKYQWLDVLHEWEDDLSSALGWSMVDDVPFEGRIMSAITRRSLAVARIRKSAKPSFVFAMNPAIDLGNGKKNIVPCFVDFFIRSKVGLQKFFEDYRRNRVLLVSSAEVMDVLRENKCPLNVQHWGLSISDRWIDREFAFKKEVDVVCLGRPNAVLMNFFETYVRNHPAITYVVSRLVEGQLVLQRHDGTVLSPLARRADYMDLMRRAKIGLYATPSIDYSRMDANGYNQITPRFLEYLSSGCQVISRYEDNSDSRYYEMDRMSRKVMTYEDFECAMDDLLRNQFDKKVRLEYLQRHSTSARAKTLMDILGSVD